MRTLNVATFKKGLLKVVTKAVFVGLYLIICLMYMTATNPPLITGLLQQFRILPEVAGQPPPELYLAGLTCLPRPFKVILQPRG